MVSGIPSRTSANTGPVTRRTAWNAFDRRHPSQTASAPWGNNRPPNWSSWRSEADYERFNRNNFNVRY